MALIVREFRVPRLLISLLAGACLGSAQLQYESAKLAYERQVQYSSVTAPINGKIESFDVEVYDRVSQSQDLCVIAGEGENIVSFYVTQRMMQNANVGDELEIQKNGTTYDSQTAHPHS